MQHVLPVAIITLASAFGAFVIQSRYPGREGSLLMRFWALQLLATAANAFVLMVVYGGRADPVAFHRQGSEVADLFVVAPFDTLNQTIRMILQFDYAIAAELKGGKGSTYTMFGLAALPAMAFNKSFYASHLLYSMLSYFGRVGIYCLFRDHVQPRHRVVAMWAALGIPSVLFWSAGMIKESIVVSVLGIFCFGAYKFGRGKPSGAAWMLLGLYFLSLLKPFILLATFMGIGAYLYWARAVRRGLVEIRPISFVASVAVAAAGVVAVGYLFPKYSIQNLGEEFAAAQAVGARDYGGSNYTISSATDTSLTGQLQYAPLGLFTGWFRPALFDVRNPQMLVNALETTALLVIAVGGVWKAGYRGLIQKAIDNPLLAYTLTFAVAFGTGAGLASANLGTLSRYRMPLVPFLAFSLFVIWLPGARRPRQAAAKQRPARRRRPSPRAVARP